MATPIETSLVAAHPFAFTTPFRIAAMPFGIRPSNSRVELVGTHLSVSFGPWSVTTPLANVAGADVTGPYDWPKVIGGPHLSLSDHGLTFASNPTKGVCLRFRDPVPGIEPFGRLKHPGLTVTVADPEALVADLDDREGRTDDLERDERAVLEGRTAAELRGLARDLGIPRASSLKKADLVDRLLANADLAGEALDRELTEA